MPGDKPYAYGPTLRIKPRTGPAPEREYGLYEIDRWLAENTLCPLAHRDLMLCELKINWSRLAGDFTVCFDDRRVPGFFFSFGGVGPGPTVTMPVVHSPLFVPATFTVVDVSPAHLALIERTLRSVLPPVAEDWAQPLEARLPSASTMRPYKRRLNRKFKIVVPLPTTLPLSGHV